MHIHSKEKEIKENDVIVKEIEKKIIYRISAAKIKLSKYHCCS